MSRILWFPQPRTTDPEFVIAGLGIREPMPGLTVDRPDGLDGWLLVHFADPVDVVLQRRKRALPASTLVLWPPRALHWFGSRARWTHSWLWCRGARASTTIAASGLKPMEAIAQPDAGLGAKWLQLMRTEVLRYRPPDAGVLDGLLALWLRTALRASGDAAPIPPRLLAVRQAIEADPARPFALPELARMADLSVSRFSAEFGRCFGTSPMRYLLDLRLQRAVYWLADRSLSVKQVAARCGFADQRYFARRFRARFGRAPGAHRRV